MNTAQPIREKQQLRQLADYYGNEKPNPRNRLLIVVALNTALRISDVLSLRWSDVYDTDGRKFWQHITLVEAKTGKKTSIYMNKWVQAALRDYMKWKNNRICGGEFLFQGRKGAALSRTQAYRIVHEAGKACGIEGVISPHSLRKTFGYQAWKHGTKPVLLMEIYQHSSFNVTKRYLGIEQDDKDNVFKGIYQVD